MKVKPVLGDQPPSHGFKKMRGKRERLAKYIGKYKIIITGDHFTQFIGELMVATPLK